MILDPRVAFLARLDARARLFPEGAACPCGEARRFLLVAGADPPRCHECDREARGLSRTEVHHLGGRPSAFTAEVPANLHRVLSDLQATLWRGRVAPGSLQAVLFDVAALIALGAAWARAGEAAA